MFIIIIIIIIIIQYTQVTTNTVLEIFKNPIPKLQSVMKL